MKRTILACALTIAVSLLPPSANAEDAGRVDSIDVSGDLRLRYEEIDQEGSDVRDRARYRARLGLSVDVDSNVKLIMQLGSGVDDPVSGNVTFDGGFTTKDIGFNLVYVDWTPIAGMHVFGGKMKNPLFRAGRTALVWDSDLNPEGIALTYSRGNFFGNTGVWSVEERSTSGDSILLAAQLGARFDIGDKDRLTVGVGYFGYSNTIGHEPFYDGAPKGNTVDPAGNYIYGYKDTELFAQFDTRIGNLPLSVHAQWVRNAEVSEQDTGVSFGARIGSAKSKGQWELGWAYQDIEADSVIGTFNESDFGGGGTDASGHIIKAKYAMSEKIFLGGTIFVNEINHFSLPEEDYDRIQLDIVFRFD